MQEAWPCERVPAGGDSAAAVWGLGAGAGTACGKVFGWAGDCLVEISAGGWEGSPVGLLGGAARSGCR